MGCLMMVVLILSLLLLAVSVNSVIVYFCWNYLITYLASTMFNTTLPVVNWTQAFVIGVLLYLVEVILSSTHHDN